VLVTLLPTGQLRVIEKFSSWSQSKTSWPPLVCIIFKPRMWYLWNLFNHELSVISGQKWVWFKEIQMAKYFQRSFATVGKI